MNRSLWQSVVLAATLTLVALAAPARADQVAAVLWRGSPSEQAALQGLREALSAAGGAAGEQPSPSVTAESAQGDPERSRSLLEKAAAERPKALVAVGAPVAQQALAAAGDLPVVYLNVWDPVAAKVIADWASSGNHAVGVSNCASIRQRVEYALALFPQAQRWAVISGPDPDALAQVAEVTALGDEFGLLSVEVGQGKTPEALVAETERLVADADLVFTVDDGLTEAAMAQIASAAAAAGKPVIAGTEAGVEAGAVAGLSVDYRELGRQAGALLAQVLTGTAPAALPSETPAGMRFVINLKAARALGLNLPLDILGLADRVIE